MPPGVFSDSCSGGPLIKARRRTINDSEGGDSVVCLLTFLGESLFEHSFVNRLTTWSHLSPLAWPPLLSYLVRSFCSILNSFTWRISKMELKPTIALHPSCSFTALMCFQTAILPQTCESKLLLLGLAALLVSPSFTRAVSSPDGFLPSPLNIELPVFWLPSKPLFGHFHVLIFRGVNRDDPMQDPSADGPAIFRGDSVLKLDFFFPASIYLQ